MGRRYRIWSLLDPDDERDLALLKVYLALPVGTRARAVRLCLDHLPDEVRRLGEGLAEGVRDSEAVERLVRRRAGAVRRPRGDRPPAIQTEAATAPTERPDAGPPSASEPDRQAGEEAFDALSRLVR